MHIYHIAYIFSHFHNRDHVLDSTYTIGQGPGNGQFITVIYLVSVLCYLMVLPFEISCQDVSQISSILHPAFLG